MMETFSAGQFDIAVIGAGHAGIEAALAAARSIHDNYKRIGGFKGPKPKSVNRR